MSQFDIASYDFDLPDELIAQRPVDEREYSRLLHLDLLGNNLFDKQFPDLIGLIHSGDLVVVNNTRVFPARLLGRKETGGRAELMLLHYPAVEHSHKVAGASSGSQEEEMMATVSCLVKSSKRPKPGAQIFFGPKLSCEVLRIEPDATVLVSLRWQGDLDGLLHQCGHIPLPPYIQREQSSTEEDRKRYQTVYAQNNGAIAAPTAGLHFTEELLQQIRAKGADLSHITLHVGFGTFSPVRVADIRDHQIHAEHVSIPQETVDAVTQTRERGGKIWAVGTTTTRALEAGANGVGGIQPMCGACSLYIYPGYTFQVVDNLITNFHLPKSSLLFLVSAFAGRECVMAAYQHAVKQRYRFYSYGDAMVLTTR